MISTDLVEHFAVLRDPPQAIGGAVGPIGPPPDVLAKMKRPDGPATFFGLDVAHPLRVLAQDELWAWLIPGAKGVCLVAWDNRMHNCGAMSGPIDDAIRGTFVNLMGSMPAGTTVFRAVGLVPDDVIEVTRSSAAGIDEQIPIRNNVWTISEEPADGVVTLHWRTLDTQEVRVSLQRPPRR